MAQHDIQFGRKAVEMGWLSSEQLKQCFKVQQRMWKRGENLSLVECIKKEGFLNDNQIDVITKKCEQKEISTTPVKGEEPLRIERKKNKFTQSLPQVSKDSVLEKRKDFLKKSNSAPRVSKDSVLEKQKDFLEKNNSALPAKMSGNFLKGSKKIEEPTELPTKAEKDSVLEKQKDFLEKNNSALPAKMSGNFLKGSKKIEEPTELPTKVSGDFLQKLRKQTVGIPVQQETEKSPVPKNQDLGKVDIQVQKMNVMSDTLAYEDFGKSSKTPSDNETFDTDDTLQLGAMFCHYKILQKLGQGGMGVVYKAFDSQLKRNVALKFLLNEETLDKKQIARFLQEAAAIAQFDHPNIIKIFEVRSTPRTYFAMEYVEGKTLDYFIDKKSLKPIESAKIIKTVANAIHEAHRKQIIHRDIKPGNIIITGNNEPKLMDFGLAKITSINQNLTKRGTILGTPNYMAPEQFEEGDSSDKRIDIYALGATLYEMITWRRLFEGYSPVNIAAEIVTTRPTPPRRFNPDIPKDLELICLKCLEKLPKKRYLSGQLLAKDLGNFIRGKAISINPRKLIPRAKELLKRKHTIFSLLSIVIVSVFLITVSRYSASVDALEKSEKKLFEILITKTQNTKINFLFFGDDLKKNLAPDDKIGLLPESDIVFLEIMEKWITEDKLYLFFSEKPRRDFLFSLCILYNNTIYEKRFFDVIEYLIEHSTEKKAEYFFIQAYLRGHNNEKTTLLYYNKNIIKEDFLKNYPLYNFNFSEAFYSKAIEIDPNYLEAYFFRGFVFFAEALRDEISPLQHKSTYRTTIDRGKDTIDNWQKCLSEKKLLVDSARFLYEEAIKNAEESTSKEGIKKIFDEIITSLENNPKKE